jgi:hypothetical protein
MVNAINGYSCGLASDFWMCFTESVVNLTSSPDDSRISQGRLGMLVSRRAIVFLSLS